MEPFGYSHGNARAVLFLLPVRKIQPCRMFSKAVGRLTLITVTINWPFLFFFFPIGPFYARNCYQHFSNPYSYTMRYKWHYLHFTDKEMRSREGKVP